jgi:hypothetical protein
MNILLYIVGLTLTKAPHMSDFWTQAPAESPDRSRSSAGACKYHLFRALRLLTHAHVPSRRPPLTEAPLLDDERDAPFVSDPPLFTWKPAAVASGTPVACDLLVVAVANMPSLALSARCVKAGWSVVGALDLTETPLVSSSAPELESTVRCFSQLLLSPSLCYRKAR